MSSYKPKDLKTKTNDELKEKLKLLRKEQFNLRVQQMTGQLSRNHEHKRVRREIARVKTKINQIKE